jgi:hypothetical protein
MSEEYAQLLHRGSGSVLIAARDGENAGAQDVGQQMDDPVRITLVRDYASESIGDAQTALCLCEQHHSAVRGDPSAIEGGADLLASDCW